jgi:membrane protein
MRKRVVNYYNKSRKRAVDMSQKVMLPFLGGLPLYWIVLFFFRNLRKESINLRASSIAFNLFLSLFPALIFMFTLLPYIPIEDLSQQIMSFMRTVMPKSSFEIIDETLQDILSTPRSGLLSIGLVSAIYFASNGIFALIETYNKRDKRSFWKKRLLAIGLTFLMGILIITIISLFIVTEYSVELLIYYTPLNDQVLYYALILVRWLMLFFLMFSATTILYRHADSRAERWRHIFPGAFLATLLTVITSVLYAFYLNNWGNYNRFYGSLGAIIITMLWLYFNAMVLIIGHEFNRSLVHARIAVLNSARFQKKKKVEEVVVEEIKKDIAKPDEPIK